VKVRLKPPQWQVFRCAERFRVLVAGRRFGKTYLALNELCRAAWGAGRLAWYVAPTYKQAKRIAWKPLKQLTRPYWAMLPNETDLRIELMGGGAIALRGADNYDGLRGDGLDFVVLDEYASMAPETWTEVLRPALSDRRGGALFISTPKGHNHLYELFQAARESQGWRAFQFTTEEGGLVAREELETARRELDQRTYRQEYQASFENATGLVYYAFDRDANVKRLQRDPRLPLVWSLDFNVDLMCSILAQVRPGEVVRYGALRPDRHLDRVEVLEELTLPHNSNTLEACEEFHGRVESWGEASITVRMYGDPAGHQRRTSASRTDWQIVKDFFQRHRQYHLVWQVRSKAPEIKDRVNCVNALLCNAEGEQRCFIDPRCPQLIRDLSQVSWKTDLNGNTLGQLDKSDPRRTHLSDALGYFIEREYSMRPRVGEQGPKRP